MVLVVFAANHSRVPHFDRQNAQLPILISGCAVVFSIFTIFLERVVNSPNFYSSTFRIFIPLPALLMLQYMGFFLYFGGDDNCKEEGDDNNRRLHCKGRLLPRTPYSIGDIDQAVALCIGIVTLLLSIHDMIQDSKFSTSDEFEYLRVRCVRNIECGDTEVEVVRWKQELDAIDKKAKCERTRARHRKREHETYEKLPKEVKCALRNYIIDRSLAESGFL